MPGRQAPRLPRPTSLGPGGVTFFLSLPFPAFLQVSLTTENWDECAAWLTALKRLIKACQSLG